MTEPNPHPYYRRSDAGLSLTLSGRAALMDVPVEFVVAQLGTEPGWAERIPPGWAERGNRVRAECWRALGWEADLFTCLDYLAGRMWVLPASRSAGRWRP
ncbi:hypothetical protein SAMN04489713_104268 [Actinomadura madurae]|uniref:Uncharacterized protein n=1 Tax=Actinomadura madurae TaxID=1993 RepID=A0A1I5ET11_9ACTN|nr:hypothetical protein [Actinomadura madurae]SFO14579.1 hypothetical protein SAMN04489713_104268 [Actinomadura madurae]